MMAIKHYHATTFLQPHHAVVGVHHNSKCGNFQVGARRQLHHLHAAHGSIFLLRNSLVSALHCASLISRKGIVRSLI